MALSIRTASTSDASAIAAIYDHHARHGTASFDLAGPDAAFWSDKIAAIQARNWPFLVAVDGADVVGFAYASQFRDRPAYARTGETSIYIAADRIGQGVGTLLLAALIDAVERSGFEQLIAVIGGGEPASVALHRKFGFQERGRMTAVGFKFGRRLDSVYMQRAVGSGAD